MDKKIRTFKSHQFVFSRKFSTEKMTSSLVETRVLYRTVIDLPILPQLAEQIEEEAIIKSIFGSAAIEGNPLKEEVVAKILPKSGETEKLERAEKEMRNLKFTYDFIGGLQPTVSPFELTEDIIKEIHLNITKDIEYKYNIPRTIESWVWKEKIPHIKLGRCVRFDLGQIQEWLKAKTVGAMDVQSSSHQA